MKRIIFLIIMCLLTYAGAQAGERVMGLGLSAEHFRAGEVPRGWKLRKFPGRTKGARAEWVTEDGVRSVKLSSRANLTFLEKTVNIDISEYPVVAWKWKVENILEGNDERTREGDDHPVRLFFVFEPDESKGFTGIPTEGGSSSISGAATWSGARSSTTRESRGRSC
jgi:hypothetical protein